MTLPSKLIFNFKLFFIISIIYMCTSHHLHAQSSDVVLDSLLIYYNNLKDSSEMTPPSVNSAAWNDRKVQLDIALFIKNPSKIATLYVSCGNTIAANDLFDGELIYLKEGQQEFLIFKNKRFNVVKNMVRVTALVPASSVMKATHYKVYAKDITARLSNTLAK